MQNFIHQKNIELYRKRLAEITDPVERARLKKLLKDEEAKELQSSDKQQPSASASSDEVQ
jgi:hypothetical protein